MTWTPERVERLTALWKDGKSASEIMRDLRGGLSRSAVIGKVHRLGLCDSSGNRGSGRFSTGYLNNRPAKLAKPPRPATILVKPNAPPASSKPGVYVSGGSVHTRAASAPLPALRELSVCTTARPWLTRKSRECAWPVGDPEQAADQLSCCAPTLDGATYCESHLKIRTSSYRWGFNAGGAKELERALRKHVA